LSLNVKFNIVFVFLSCTIVCTSPGFAVMLYVIEAIYDNVISFLVSSHLSPWLCRDCFPAHKQPLCWNFLRHSRTVLSVGGSMWYLVRNLRCTITIDSVLANSKTERFFIPCPRQVPPWLPISGETCKYATVPATKTNLERFSTYRCAPF
jgi:hypothetical protein